MTYKNYLQQLIARGELEQAIEKFLKATEQNGQKSLYLGLISQSARFSHNEREKNNGTVSKADYSMEWNRIKEAILYYLEEYRDNGLEVAVESKQEPVSIDRFVPLPASKTRKITYQEKRYSEIQLLIQKGLILLVTATELETKALHQQMEYLPDADGLIEVKKGNATYFIGKFGNFAVANVECGMMGTGSSMGSLVTTANAIHDLSPKFVLMLGIAFGVDPEKQHIGDVLVSNTLIPYEIQRLGKDEMVWRGTKPEANNNLRNSFKNIKSWTYLLPNGAEARLELCDILTGEKLVDNIDFRKALTTTFPTANGGEMEGAGLYAACQDRAVPWILVKAICDFADGLKKENKGEKQSLAITTALDACLHVFNKKFIFDDFGVTLYAENDAAGATERVGTSQKQHLLSLLEKDDIPTLLNILESLKISDQYSYNRFRKEYQAGLKGVDLIDWKDRIKVFLTGLDQI